MTLIKRRGRWYALKGVYTSKGVAYKKGYHYRTKGACKQYIVLPLQYGKYALYCSYK